MPGLPPSQLRDHRAATDRNLLLGFFGLLFVVGGGLIYLIYGRGAAFFGLICMAAGAVLVGLLLLMVQAIDWLNRWLERRTLGEDE